MINWDSYTKHSADWHVQRLISSSGPYAFPNIPKADVVNGLRRRLSGAKNINQQNTNTCGPAAFFYVFLQTKPHLQELRQKDYCVCMLINQVILGPTQKYSGIPQHWVVLNSDINVNGGVITSPLAQNLHRNRRQDELKEILDSDESPDDKPVIRFGDTVSFEVYTWGDEHQSLRNGTTTTYLDELLYDYFGFVAAKW